MGNSSCISICLSDLKLGTVISHDLYNFMCGSVEGVSLEECVAWKHL